MDINIYNFTPHLPLVCKSTNLKTSFPYVNVPIIVIPPNSKPIYLFCNCYLFQVNKSFGKRKSCISIHVKSKINNGSALVGRKNCKRENISRYQIWYFYLNIAQRCRKYSKMSLLWSLFHWKHMQKLDLKLQNILKRLLSFKTQFKIEFLPASTGFPMGNRPAKIQIYCTLPLIYIYIYIYKINIFCGLSKKQKV